MARCLVTYLSDARRVRREVLASFGNAPSVGTIAALRGAWLRGQRTGTEERHAARHKRDKAIIAEFRAGDSYPTLSRRHDITTRRVRQIVKGAGVYLSAADLHERFRRGRGAPRLAVPPVDMALYVKARRYYGAAYARELVGVAA